MYEVECLKTQKARTNTIVTISYNFVSNKEGNIPVRFFPLNPNKIYLDEGESYQLSFIYGDEDFRTRYPDMWKPGKTS